MGRNCESPICSPPSPPSRRSIIVKKNINIDVPQRPQTSRGLNVDAELTMVTTTTSRSPIHPIVSLHKPPISTKLCHVIV
jgi:hypothetical protein